MASEAASKNTPARAARKRERARRRMIEDFMPPEGVPLHLEVAGIGARVGAQILDLVLTFLAAGCFVFLLALLDILPGSALEIIFVLLFFLIRTPYYIATEILWNGQTLGKRITGLRVIGADGRSLRPYQVTVRNLMKEAEVFYPGTMIVAAVALGPLEYAILLIWIAILITVPLMNKRRQRLGDMVAGTYVIHQPQAILAPDMAARQEQANPYSFLAHQLDHYGAFELQTLETVLQPLPATATPESLRRREDDMRAIAERIITKIGYSQRVPPPETRAFLEAFYRAQRGFLETRKLFGDERADKFHAGEDGLATKNTGVARSKR